MSLATSSCRFYVNLLLILYFGIANLKHTILTYLLLGIDPASAIISRYVRVSQPSEWAPRQPCPSCRQPLKPAGVVVALPCDHVLHLDCLNYSLTQQQAEGLHLHVQCGVCGCIYGEKHGNQPPGTMEWAVLDRSLPGYVNYRTIRIVYKSVLSILNQQFML